MTYYVTSQSNHTAVVLYDSRNVSVLGSLPASLAWKRAEEPRLLREELLG